VIGLARIRELEHEYRRCGRCARLCESRSQVVFGAGKVTANIMYIGGAPGEAEDEEGSPFVGPAGRMLLQLFEKAWPTTEDELQEVRLIDDNEEYFKRLSEFVLSRVFITNAVLCRPEEDRTPSASELKACRERLHNTIYAVDPVLIIAGGKTAASALLGKNVNILERRGELMDISITSPSTGNPIRYGMLPVLDCGFLLRKGDSVLVKEKKGHTFDTLGDFRYALQIVDTHSRILGATHARS
jgi:uracil-DNA glycosylase